MSASTIAPPESEKTRVRPGLSDEPNRAALSGETVIRLIRSPALGGLIVWAVDLVSRNCMSATLDQLSSARRAAPITSLPVLMFAGGETSELEKATMMGRTTHRRATIPEASRYCKV